MTPFDFRLDELVTNNFHDNACFFCRERNEIVLFYNESKRSEHTALVWFCKECYKSYIRDNSSVERHYELTNQDIFTLRLILNNG